MAEGTADQNDSAGRARPVRDRLRDNRWLVLGTAALLFLLFLLGAIGWPVAVLVLLAVCGLSLLVLDEQKTATRAVPSGPADTVWPETGIKLFAEALPDPCFVLDRRGIVRYANADATKVFAIRPGDALTFRLRAPDLVAAFERVSRGGAPERVEFVERVPTERWYAGWFARLDAGARAGNFVVFLVGDLTETRRIERVRVDFVANASHELRTPLASLAGFIETLQGPARDDVAARERFLKIMQEQATRMSRLVSDLLSLSRIEMKAHVRPTGEVDLTAIVRHVADALEPLARDLGVTIEIDAPPSAMVTGDRDELVQVFENLIENACKYGQAGKRVVVTVVPAAEDRGATVTVRDFGPGIAEEHIPRLTERFYRIDVEDSRRHRGTGLGLAIVKHILTRHQARLGVESKVGEGTSFVVAFPQAIPQRTLDAGEKAFSIQ